MRKKVKMQLGFSVIYLPKSDSVLIIRGKSVLKEKVMSGFSPIKAKGVFFFLKIKNKNAQKRVINKGLTTTIRTPLFSHTGKTYL